MSWLTEEWKEQLPAEATNYIQNLEEIVEKSKKELKEYQFKIQSLEAELENSKQKSEENIGETNALERQINTLYAELEKEKEESKNHLASKTSKENIICGLRKEVDRLRSDFGEVKSTNTKLVGQLETLETEQNQNDHRKNEDLDRLKELKVLNEQRLEELRRQLESLSRDKQSVEKAYEEKIKDMCRESESDKQSIKELTNHMESQTLQIQRLEAFNSKQEDQEKIKLCLQQREKEIEELQMKIQNHQCDVGNYLGIDLGKICSETSVCGSDFNEMKETCKKLVQENKELKRMLSQHTLTSVSVQSSSIGPETVLSFPMTDDQKCHQSSSAERMCLESEIQTLKEENQRMKEVYESHMRACANNARIARKSSSATIQSFELEELRRKVQILESLKEKLEKALAEKLSECSKLQQELSELNKGVVSQHAVDKLEDLVDVILQKKKSSSECLTDVPSMQNNIDPKSLKDIVGSTISSLHDELVSDHETTRQSIKDSTNKVISAIQIHLASHARNIGTSSAAHVNRNKASPRKYGYTGNPPKNSLEEVELIRDRLDHLQDTIHGRENDMRKTQKDRDRVQEELVKMMELMKKKDEELGKISCMYELEKQKVNENSSCYRAEMEALKIEQLEIYKEFREMCDNLKKKDIELLNKTKQSKLLNAEWRQREDNLNERILTLEKEICEKHSDMENLECQLKSVNRENELVMNRLRQSEDQLQSFHDSLSRVEELMFKAKGEGLYY